MSFWKDQRVLVTGGSGFLGNHLIREVIDAGCRDIHAPNSKSYDLRDVEVVKNLFKEIQPTVLIHAAARCGGIEANRLNPGTFFYDNAIMGIQIIEQARLANIKKTVILGTVCAYPKHTPTPFKEDDIWNGYPEETNAPYGLAKKMLLVQLQAYRQQYQFPGIYLLPVNLYGPRDNFNPTSSHVIPALIRKMYIAALSKSPSITLWGTGKAYREFLYVKDCVRGITLATEHYDSAEPVNLGTGSTISISDLADIIAKAVGYEGAIEWDSSKPDGQPLRQLDTQKAKSFGFEATTSLEEGISKTVEWYKSSLIHAN